MRQTCKKVGESCIQRGDKWKCELVVVTRDRGQRTGSGKGQVEESVPVHTGLDVPQNEDETVGKVLLDKYEAAIGDGRCGR